MRPVSTALAALALATICQPALAAVTNLSTADHPTPSILTLTLGVSATAFQGSIGPTPLTGTMVADISLSEPNDDGTVEILSTSLDVADIGPVTIDLGPFGTVDMQLQGLHYFLTMGPRNVVGNNFTIDGTASGTFGFDAGTLILTNATGFLGNALGANPEDIDLGADPAVGDYTDLTGPFIGNVDDDAGLLDFDGAEVSFPLGVNIDLGSGIYLLIQNRIFVGSTAVPEASTFILTGAALAGLGGFAGLRRYRRSR